MNMPTKISHGRLAAALAVEPALKMLREMLEGFSDCMQAPAERQRIQQVSAATLARCRAHFQGRGVVFAESGEAMLHGALQPSAPRQLAREILHEVDLALTSVVVDNPDFADCQDAVASMFGELFEEQWLLLAAQAHDLGPSGATIVPVVLPLNLETMQFGTSPHAIWHAQAVTDRRVLECIERVLEKQRPAGWEGKATSRSGRPSRGSHSR
jgi:hypothetical protein